MGDVTTLETPTRQIGTDCSWTKLGLNQAIPFTCRIRSCASSDAVLNSWEGWKQNKTKNLKKKHPPSNSPGRVGGFDFVEKTGGTLKHPSSSTETPLPTEFPNTLWTARSYSGAQGKTSGCRLNTGTVGVTSNGDSPWWRCFFKGPTLLDVSKKNWGCTLR